MSRGTLQKRGPGPPSARYDLQKQLHLQLHNGFLVLQISAQAFSAGLENVHYCMAECAMYQATAAEYFACNRVARGASRLRPSGTTLSCGRVAPHSSPEATHEHAVSTPVCFHRARTAVCQASYVHCRSESASRALRAQGQNNRSHGRQPWHRAGGANPGLTTSACTLGRGSPLGAQHP